MAEEPNINQDASSGAHGGQAAPQGPAQYVMGALVAPEFKAAAPAPTEPVKHKLHHTYIWLSPLEAVPYIILACALAFFPAASEMARDFTFLAGFGPIAIAVIATCVITVGIAALVFGLQALSYKFIWYEFGKGEISYYSGIFFKKHSHVPYQKIQSVNEKATLFQRFAGVCTVYLETAGGSDNKAVVIRFVSRAAAEELRREVFARKNMMDAGLSLDEIEEQMVSFHAAAAAQAGALANAAPQAPMGYAGAANPSASQQEEGAGSALPVQPPIAFDAQGNPMPAAFAPTGQHHDNVLDAPAQLMEDMRGVFGGQHIHTGKVTYEYGLTNKELVFSALSGKSSVALALIGVMAAIASVSAFFVDMRVLSEDALAQAALAVVQNAFVPQIMLVVFGGIVGLIALTWLLMVLGTCLVYGGFKARRRGDRIEVEHGLIEHEFSGMHIDRIQSVNIHQSFFQRIIGYCSVSYGRIATMGDDGQGEGNQSLGQDKLVVHPFLKLDRAQEVISSLTPEYATLPDANVRVSPKARRRMITRRTVFFGWGFWMAVLFAAGYFAVRAIGVDTTAHDAIDQFIGAFTLGNICLFGLVSSLVLMAIQCAGAIMWYRRAAFGYSEKFFTVVNGGWSVDIVVVPRNKIQYAYVRTNPLQRYAGVVTIIAQNAAGVRGNEEKLVDVPREAASEWLSWALPHGNKNHVI